LAPEAVSISAVDPTQGALSYGAAMPSYTATKNGVSIGVDVSDLDKEGLQGWAERPSMARNYTALAREDAALSGRLGNMVAQAQPNGVMGTAATLAGMFSNPAVGVLGNAVIDARQAANFRDSAFGIDTSFSQSIADIANSGSRSLAGTLGGKVGGGLLGAATGSPYGAVAGMVAGQVAGRSAFDTAMRGPVGTATDTGSIDSMSGGGNYSGAAGIQTAAATPQPQPQPQGVATGWDSTFGDYDSHLDKFTGKRNFNPSRAVGAWS
jgi:hypothetical protein